MSQSPKGPSITVCSGQTARTYEWDGERFAVVRQLNPADKQANLVATSPFKGLKGEPGMLVFDRSGRNLLWFKDGEAEPQSVHLKTDVGVVSSIISLRAKKRTNLILLGRDSMHLLAEGPARLNVLASALGLPTRTVSNVIEPFLIRSGLIAKDHQSIRQLTAKGREHVLNGSKEAV